MGASLEPQGVGGSGARHVPDIGLEHEGLTLGSVLRMHGGREEGRILDLDAHLLDRGDEHVAITILAQDRREEPHQGGPADRRAVVEPGSVGADQMPISPQ